MKTVLLTLLIIASNYSFSQSIDGVDLSEIDADYIEITVNAPGSNQKFRVDYGKARKTGGKIGESKTGSHVFLDDEGLQTRSRTPMAVVNFMCNYGQYDLQEVFFTKMENGVVKTYILKKA